MATQQIDQITAWGETVAHKAPVRAATTAPIELSGLQTIDGIALASGDRVLVKDQADARYNGIYIVSTGIWQRSRDFNGNRDVARGTVVIVTDGVTNYGEWMLVSENPIAIGFSEIAFRRVFGFGVVPGGTNGGIVFETKAQMDAALDYPENQLAWVIRDPDTANNGAYRKEGASGSGSWTRIGDLPYSFIKAENTGAGTPDAIQATTEIPVPSTDGAALIALPIAEDNTGSPVTVSLNGGSPLAIKSISGENLEPGALAAGMIVAGYIDGANFQLLSDSVSAALVAQMEELLAEMRRLFLGAYPNDAAATAAAGGNPQEGALYWNTTEKEFRVYNGTEWDPILGDMLKRVYDPGNVEGNAFDGHPFAADESIASLSTDLYSAARLTADGKEGSFTLKAGSPPVSDPQKAIYIISDTNGFFWERDRAGPINAKWFGAKGNGDPQAVAIQRAIDLANEADGATVWFDPGLYIVEQTLIPKSHVKLQGTYGSATLKVQDGIDIFLLVNRLELGVTLDVFELEGLIFDGNAQNAPRAGAKSVVDLSRSNRTRAVRCDFINGTGYGLGYQAVPNWPEPYPGEHIDIYLENCRFLNNGIGALGGETYDGFDVKYSDRLVMVGCFASGNFDKGIDVRGRRVALIGNSATANASYGFGLGANATYPDLPPNNLPSEFSVIANSSYGNTEDGIVVYGGSPGRIHVSITGNDINSNGARGIYLNDPTAITRAVISSNSIWGNGDGGIYSLGAESLMVSANTIVSNDNFGIRSAGNNITVTGNELANHAGPGVQVDSASGRALVTSNKIRENGTGVQTAGSNGLYAYNWFEGNTTKVTDTGTGNKFRGNVGLVTENRVRSPSFPVDSVGVKTVTIPHGLDFTPSINDVQLTLLSLVGDGGYRIGWVRARSTTSSNITAEVYVETADVAGTVAYLLADVRTRF